MLYSWRAISICFMAAMLLLSSKPAAAGLATNPAFGANNANASSWLAGAHAGYNWQQGSMVYGFETDYQATHLNSSMTGGLTPSSTPGSDFASTTALINSYGTFRGRLGYTTGQWLFYGTGGFAFGNVDLSSTFSTLGASTFAQTSEPRIGWVAGVGFEYLLRPNWTLNVGYQYVDLGRVGVSSSAVEGFLALGQTASVHAQFQAVTVGMSWRFAPDGSPSPWAGGYAGGHVGGAWGNNANGLYSSSFLPPPPPP